MNNRDLPVEYTLIFDILNENISASLATINQKGQPHGNTIYYCYDEKMNLYFASDCQTEHANNILHTPNVAVTIWQIPSSYGIKHSGLQIEGLCMLVSGLDLIKAWWLYIKRFPIFKTKIGNLDNITNKIVNMRLYKIAVSRIQLTSSEKLGNELIDLQI